MENLQTIKNFLKLEYNIQFEEDKYFLYKEKNEIKKKITSDDGITIYTDGAVSNNKLSKKTNLFGGIGIWSSDLNIQISEKYENATNNKMELLAILKAVEIVNNMSIKKKVTIYSDSQYSIKSCTVWYKKWIENNWKTSMGKDVENQDFIKPIIVLLEKNNNIILKYVSGHSGNYGNERADKLATSAIKQ